MNDFTWPPPRRRSVTYTGRAATVGILLLIAIVVTVFAGVSAFVGWMIMLAMGILGHPLGFGSCWGLGAIVTCIAWILRSGRSE